MAYPTGTLGIVLSRVDERIASLKQLCIRTRDRAAAGPIVATVIIDTFIHLQDERNALLQARSVPGLAEYARAQKGNDTLDIVAEFNAVITAIEAASSWISSNFPADANGFLLRETLGANSPVDRSFATAATAGFRSSLQAIIDRII